MKHFALTITCWLACVPAVAWAQPKAPVPIDVPAAPGAAVWAWPAEQAFTLRNGLHVAVITKADESLVNVALFVPAGKATETPQTRGAADLVAGWVRAGSSRRDAMPLELRVEELGADVQVQVDRLGTTLLCKAMFPRLQGCLALLADLVEAPAFKSDRLIEVRSQLAAQVRQQLASDEGRARAHFYNLVFGDEHPAGQAVQPDDIGGLTEATLRAFWQQWYRPNLSRLVVVGNVSSDVVNQAAAAAFKGWKAGASPRAPSPPVPVREGTRLLLVDSPTAPQATLMFGHMLAAKDAAEWAALESLTFVYGGAGLGSRLAQNVATKGLIAAGGAALEPTAQGRLLRTTLQAPAAKTWDALLAAASQLKAFAEQGVLPAELAELKARSAAVDPLQLETGDGLALAVLEAEAVKTGGLSYFKALSKAVEVVDNKALQSAASRLKPDALAVVIVGPAKVIAPQLQKAKVRFEQIAFEDPLSVSARARRDRLVHNDAATSAESMQARGLIMKALAAAGGAPAWRALTTLTVKKQGQRREGGRIVTMTSTTHYRRPNDVRVEQEARVRDKVVGQAAFVLTAQQVRGTNAKGALVALPAENVSRLRAATFEDVVFILLNILDAKPPVPVAPKQPWVEKGVSYPGIEVQVPAGAWISLYFDPNTNLLSRVRSPDVAGGESEQRLLDWRDVGGLKFPFKQLSFGPNTSEATITDVQINPVLPPTLFE